MLAMAMAKTQEKQKFGKFQLNYFQHIQLDFAFTIESIK